MYPKILTTQLILTRAFPAFSEKGKFLVSGGSYGLVQLIQIT
jgi:hypothetical protein